MAYVNATYAMTEEVAVGTRRWWVRATDTLWQITETPDIVFSLAVDNEPPMISNLVMPPISPAMGEAVRITAMIDNAISEVQGATIFYSTNGRSSWERVAMISLMPPAISYEGSIPAQGPIVKVQFYIGMPWATLRGAQHGNSPWQYLCGYTVP